MELRQALPKIVTETVPGPKSKALIDRRAAATATAVKCVYPVAIERGEGAMVEDLDGNIFLDWVGGVGVLNVGYSQPELIPAKSLTKKNVGARYLCNYIELKLKIITAWNVQLSWLK